MRRTALLIALIALLASSATAVAATHRAKPKPAKAAAKPSYRYLGKSTQGVAIRLAAVSHGARWFRYRARMTCSDGSTFLDDYFSDDVTVKKNRFSVSYKSNAGAISTKVTGTLKGKRASGTIRIIERYSQNAVNGVTPLAANGSIVCDSKTVKWSAKA